jgi:hypothetical protein
MVRRHQHGYCFGGKLRSSKSIASSISRINSSSVMFRLVISRAKTNILVRVGHKKRLFNATSVSASSFGLGSNLYVIGTTKSEIVRRGIALPLPTLSGVAPQTCRATSEGVVCPYD